MPSTRRWFARPVPALPRRILALGLALVAVPAGPARAQMTEPDRVIETYSRRDVMIAMRDGVRLFTTIYTPKDTSRTYPILLTRTPYGTDTYLRSIGPSVSFERAGYIFVFQDVRGRYQSEGEFVNVRPFIPNKERPDQIDEASDTYDTIDWLVKETTHHNGNVGVWGISYLGFYSTMAILSGHPALKAVSPQAPVTDWFIGDDFHHNGALFLADAYFFLSSFGVPRPAPTRHREPGADLGTPDSYAFFLRAGPLRNLDSLYFKGRIPFWTEMTRHPNYDAWWKARTPLPYLRGVRPAVLTVGSWFDAEDVWGTMQVYRTIEAGNPGADNAIAIGPWYHGQWWFEDGESLGDMRWGSKTSVFYQDSILLPFFERHLRGRGGPALPEAQVFETGADRWRTFGTWPPAGVERRSLFLEPGGRLAWTAGPRSGFDAYPSDPAHPVPYLDIVAPRRPGSHHEYMVADQRFASRRPDVLTYQTDPLSEDLTIAGPIEAALRVSTTGTDADWVVKVIDVWPDDSPDPEPNPAGVHLGGYQELIRGDIFRGRYRQSFEKPVAFIPNVPASVGFTMPDVLHTFKRGHRVMVQVQSSWFPLADRNPQTFVNIYRATERDFQKATMRVYRGGATGSSIRIGVLTGAP